MATAKAQYIIPHYSSQVGTFGQKLIYQGKERESECTVGRLPAVCYVSLITAAFKWCPYYFHAAVRAKSLERLSSDLGLSLRECHVPSREAVIWTQTNGQRRSREITPSALLWVGLCGGWGGLWGSVLQINWLWFTNRRTLVQQTA